MNYPTDILTIIKDSSPSPSYLNTIPSLVSINSVPVVITPLSFLNSAFQVSPFWDERLP